MRIFILLAIAALMIPACASSYAAKCNEWHPYKSWAELKIGAVERHDVYRCVSFAEVP